MVKPPLKFSSNLRPPKRLVVPANSLPPQPVPSRLDQDSLKHMGDEELLRGMSSPRPLREIEAAVGRAIGRRLAIVVCPVGRVVDLDARSVARTSEAGGSAVDAAGLWCAGREMDIVVLQKLLRLGGCGGHDGLGCVMLVDGGGG